MVAQDASVEGGFGGAVSVSNDVAVIGASSKTGGSAYVFTEVDGSWTQIATLRANDTLPGDRFGASVAISSSTIIVGAPNGTHGAGKAYVFEQVQGVWSEQARLQPRDRVRIFGTSTAIAGDIIVVGAPGDADMPGAAYAYMRAGNGWTQHAKLTACNPTSADGFGISVAVSGFTTAVGSYSQTAHVFVRNAGVWGRKVPLTRNTSHSFGHAVATDGSTLLTGAPLASN
eukprot:COSAG02_NODE_17918_length_971_cov_1.575688_1_plen_228_part_10